MITVAADGRVLGDDNGEFRLLAFTNDAGGDPDACHEWTRGTGSHGYGVLGLAGGDACAHRVAYELAHGPIPEVDDDGEPVRLVVRHTCDNRLCCNPRHLVMGTQADNMADMDARGRRNQVNLAGESHGMARTTQEMASEIVARYAAGGVTQYRLADEYGVSQATVNDMIHGRHFATRG